MTLGRGDLQSTDLITWGQMKIKPLALALLTSGYCVIEI